MYRSGLLQEIKFLHSQLDVKRRKLSDGFRNKISFEELEKLYEEINEVESKLRLYFQKFKTHAEENGLHPPVKTHNKV